MKNRGEIKGNNSTNPMRKTSAEDVNGLLSEVNRLNAAIDVLTTKLSEKELSLKDSASQALIKIGSAEQRANYAEERLHLIEHSVGWRVLRATVGKLDRHPKLKIFLKRSIKVARWTANGQLLTKVRQYRNARKFDSTILNSSPQPMDGYDTFWVNRSDLPHVLLNEIFSFISANGSITLIVAVNFYAAGGAESAALEYAVSYANKSKCNSVLFVMTDKGPRRSLPDLPSNILVLDLTTVDESFEPERVENYLYLIMRSVSLETIHIVNSIAAYNLIARIPKEFLSDINVISSVYALQFDPLNKERIIGYGKDFLPGTIDKIDCVVTDNRRFSIEGPLKLGLMSSADKFKTVYNKCKLGDEINIAISRSLLAERICFEERLKVVWAGRLDREKRVDLLLQIAELAQSFCDFIVYGGSVVDGGFESELEKLPNVRLMGAYRSPLDWDAKIKGNVFLFTSVWEGMPNTVIEAAYMGFPIVASKVGGVGELVTPETGWGIDRYDPAKTYVEALAAIFQNGELAMSRTEALIDLAHKRHDRSSYLDSLSTVPGYSKVK